MAEQLNEKIIADLCRILRVVDVFEKNKEVYADNPELIKNANELKKKAKEMIDLLTEDQLNYILEEFIEQKAYLANLEEKKSK